MHVVRLARLKIQLGIETIDIQVKSTEEMVAPKETIRLFIENIWPIDEVFGVVAARRAASWRGSVRDRVPADA